jgi:hypothetical protein
MAMVFLVSPCYLSTRQALTISENKTCRPVCESAKRFQSWNKKKCQDTLSNLFKGDIIKTSQHLPLHLIKGLCMASNAEPKLCCAPVLLNEVQFTVVLGIVITQVAMGFDIFLKQWLLRCEVGLRIEEMATAAMGWS